MSTNTNKPSSINARTPVDDAALAYFTPQLLHWYKDHGRHDLPWQRDRDPYAIWLSEIMLQQTQVSTVIDYYQRFRNELPDLSTLANAPQDQVLKLWSGLGYYARARNLYRAAQLIMSEHQGHFPTEFDALLALPGIGESTAGAILSFAFDQHHAILDGNVKRVLCRYFAVDHPINRQQTLKQLWHLARTLTPAAQCADYNQAIMDLGATLCKRRNPDCGRCPVSQYCQARQRDAVHQYPLRQPRQKQRPQKSTFMLILLSTDNEIWFEQRPPLGIWGGLWSFPEYQEHPTALQAAQRHGQVESSEELTPLNHEFSHFSLKIQPLLVRVKPNPSTIADNATGRWHPLSKSLDGGLPKPVSTLLNVVSDYV